MANERMHVSRLVWPVAFLAAVLAGCAALDQMAVGQTQRLEEGQFYVDTAGPTPGPVGSVLTLPVTLDPELAGLLGYGDRTREFAPLLAAMDARLKGMSCCRFSSTVALPSGAPHVYLGSAQGELAPPEAEQQLLPHDRFPPMVLHLARPSADWSVATSSLLAREGLGHAVIIRLGVSQYPKGRDGVFGKQVLLGTGYQQPIRFLTAEDKLLDVLQLTGVLVDASGSVVRAGAEGIIARDTPFLAQVADVTRVIDDESLRQVLATEKRADLPGDPLKWEVALGNLLAQLRGDRAALRVP
jgi:hypothetical protein